MQKSLVGLLSFLILAPSLVCAMPLCDEEMSSMETMEAPCPDHPAMMDSDRPDIEITMLMADCLDIDLLDTSKYSELNSSVGKDSSPQAYDYAYEAFQQFQYLGDGGARAPPGVKRELLRPTSSIILTTQRFRI